MKLLQTKDYLFLIDEKVTIVKYADYIYREDFNTVLKHINDNPEKLWQGCYKIVAYHPLIKEAIKLDLPLLPKPFEEVDKSVELANNYVNKEYKDYAFKDLLVDIFLEGYKAAQTKQFSLEDMIAFSEYVGSYYANIHNPVIPTEELLNNFTQSLTTQKLPKEFIPEYYTNGDMIVKNRNGVRELVGTYKY